MLIANFGRYLQLKIRELLQIETIELVILTIN